MTDQPGFSPPPPPPPPPPPSGPPPGYQGQPGVPPPPPVSYQQPGYPGQMPQPLNPSGAGLVGSAFLINQFTGAALGSIIAGVLSIGLPLFTTFYFPILPVFGVIGAIGAMLRGKFIGGIVGLILNVIGGYMSLQASGMLGGG